MAPVASMPAAGQSRALARHPEDRSGPVCTAIVLWTGRVGGAETWSLALAHSLAARGVPVSLIILGERNPIFDEASVGDLPCSSLGLARGRDVLLHLGELSRVCAATRAEVMILPGAGFLAGLFRTIGYRGRIIAIEHGGLLQFGQLPWPRRAHRYFSEASGFWAVDVQVTPSEFMKKQLARLPHARRVVCIPPGLDLSAYRSRDPRHGERGNVGRRIVTGFAGRLIPGKGVDVLLRALASLDPQWNVVARIAGDGPARGELQRLAVELHLGARVEFTGVVRDMPVFWKSCDLAVTPSHELIESFGMVAVEAMACGLPVIASARGGLTEIVRDGETGAVFHPGNWRELAGVLAAYAADHRMLELHGRAARARCESMFEIGRCARDFERLINELCGRRAGPRSLMAPGAGARQAP